MVAPEAAPELAPSPFFLEHDEHAVIDDASATAARARYKEDVMLGRAFAAVLSAVTLALVCSTGTARANGRFPQAQAILTVPGGDGSTVFLRATFGILVSRDAGKSWRWICERALGYEGNWDPPIAVTRDGRLWIGLERGLVSTVDGCAIETTSELTGEQVKDLTTDAKGETLWALTGAPDKRGAVWRRSSAGESKDESGAKWERMGLMPENIHPMTLEVAPSKPSRIYVTAQPYGTVRGWLWRSDDGGKTFTGKENDLAHTGPFFIAAIDTKDPNRVVLRHLHTTGSTVLVTPDAGKTFKETLSMDSAMFGFAKTADGSIYFAGSGLAVDGIFRSNDRGEHFERVSNNGVLCLHAAPAGRLFVCDNPFTLGGNAIAVSTDQGRTITPIAKFTDVLGPMACGANADGAAGLCDQAWPDILAGFLPRDAGSAAADGGRVRRRRDGGAEQDATPARRSACGCTVIGASENGADRSWLSAGLLPLVVWAAARRRPGSRRNQSGKARLM